MKRVLLFAMLALGGALVFSMFTTAKTPSLAESFAAAKPDTTGPSGTYNFDKAHSTIGFRVKHMGLTEIPGFFRDFTGAVVYDSSNVGKSSVTFTAKATSIDTGIAPRDNHLRTADFFDAATYPDVTFTSTRIEKKGKQWMVTGDFKMKDVTKSITFPFDIYGFLKGQNGSTRMGIGAETMINRQEYNVKYNSKLPDGTPSVDDNVKVILQIEANLPGPPKAAASPSE